jgi:HlyD family secretion protein
MCERQAVSESALQLQTRGPMWRKVALAAVAIAVIVAAVIWWKSRRPAVATHLTLHGNVDLREVDLPFNGTERIAEVLVQEGDRVHTGQVLARLDTRRLVPMVDQVVAQTASQREVVARLHNGNRPEEVAESQASLESARADAENARQHYQRLLSLGQENAVSQQDVDNAKDAADMAQAKLVEAEKAHTLEVVGPRKEDLAQAEDQLRADEAQLAFLRQQLTDASLLAPTTAVVRSRLMEPGEMASPQKPVFSLAITDPKWIRAYVTEPDLGKVHPGMSATIAVDGFPGKRFDGWVGFISPVAEFTPKTVQTDALRPDLVYEIRVFVRDSADVLRLGMPASVSLSLLTTQPRSDTSLSTTVPVLPERAPSGRP